MATNKHATIRYHALDRCFANTGRRYYIENLIEACNVTLYDYTGIEDGIKRRQIFEDINFMESEQGWSIPLERCKDGKRVFYRYEDSSFSIKNQAINQTEANQLKETITILNRFKGMPQFEWMEELLVRIESTFHLKENSSVIVGFEQNPYLKGLNFFSELFNAIQYKKVLSIRYQGFKQENPVDLIIHPYYLKQYNNRWFLFGYNSQLERISNLAIDRIAIIAETNQEYIENNSIDFEEYFEDVVGVTINYDQNPETIILKISRELWPYIESKPIHGSQKVLAKEENYVTITLLLQINYEFITLIFSYGDAIEIIEPEQIKSIIKDKALALINNYN
jgi:predicted DNA-binding transcriptional regulator YafY